MADQSLDDAKVAAAQGPTPSAGPASTAGSVRLRRRRRRRRPFVSGFILIVFVICGLFGPWFAPHDPDKVDLAIALRPPAWNVDGSWSYLLGTDELGRDIVSRLLSGARVSLIVAVTVVLFAGLIGLTVALIAGYVGGRLDSFLMRIADTSFAFPFMVLAIAIVGTFGASLNSVVVVLVIAGWPQYARVLRSDVLRVRQQDFVLMSRVMGAPSRWILWRHILPNIVGTLLVLATLQVGLAIIVEGSLSFLGIGVPPPGASWGNMLAKGRSYVSSAWWIPVFPGLCLSLVVLAANLMGDWLQARLDPTRR